MRVVAWLLVAVPVLVLSLIGLRYLVRGTPIRRVRTAVLHEAQPAVADPDFRRVVALLSQLQLAPGNRAQILCSGDETYPLLFDDLASATRSITVQMYYCKPGKLADRFHAILTERARAGAKVLCLFDAFGAQDLSDEYLASLRAAGCEVASFRPVQWYALEKAYNRSHIRVVVVDARVAYTGGFGIDDKWLGDGRHKDQWRDTNVRFTGPAVAGLQATFAAGWAEATGDLLTGPPFFDGTGDDDAVAPVDPSVRTTGGDEARELLAGVMHCAPTVGSTTAERFLALTIGGSRHSLDITNAYFVPDAGFTDLLARAARRGVRVRILTAGEATDVRSTRFAGRAHYEPLLRAGVRIWEYQPTMVHAKTIVADGCLVSIGTMNFDNRSMVFNDESNFVALDDQLGRAMHDVFDRDLTHAREVTLEAFLRRPWSDRVQERIFTLLTRIL
ncbi:MAG TPA: phospholipase D-like domain-containing protein [Gemmatimonadaceae bacterium]|nr:phospholipase D-like domain-containing protein [Gemmatimonadaceae bacterium]